MDLFGDIYTKPTPAPAAGAAKLAQTKPQPTTTAPNKKPLKPLPKPTQRSHKEPVRKPSNKNHGIHNIDFHTMDLKKISFDQDDEIKSQKEKVTKAVPTGPKLTAKLARTIDVPVPAKKYPTKRKLAPAEQERTPTGDTNDYLALDPVLKKYATKAKSQAEFIAHSSAEDKQAWRQFRNNFDEDKESMPGMRMDVQANSDYDAVYNRERENFIQQQYEREKARLQRSGSVFKNIEGANRIDQEAKYNATQLWKKQSREVMQNFYRKQSLSDITTDEKTLKEATILAKRDALAKEREMTLNKANALKNQLEHREEKKKKFIEKNTGLGIETGDDPKQLSDEQKRAQLANLTKKYHATDNEFRDLNKSLAEIKKQNIAATKTLGVGVSDDADVALYDSDQKKKRQRTNEKKSDQKKSSDQQLVRLGAPGTGKDSIQPISTQKQADKPEEKKAETKEKKLHGKQAQLAKTAEKNAKLLSKIYNNGVDTDDNDWLLHRRQDELELYEKKSHLDQNKKDKGALHTRYIKITLEFMKQTFERIKISKQKIKNGEEPSHEYDHFLTYPLDIAAIVDKLGAEAEIITAFEWLHQHRGLIWDFKITKAQQSKHHEKISKASKEHKSNEQKQFALEQFAEKQRTADMFNSSDQSIKGQHALQLRPINNSDTAYMTQKRTKVLNMERILEKENQFVNLQNKLTEKQYRSKRLTQKTSKGQPVMKHRVKDLLKKISDVTAK